MGKLRFGKNSILAISAISVGATILLPNIVAAEAQSAYEERDVNRSAYILQLMDMNGAGISYEDWSDIGGKPAIGSTVEYSFDGKTGWKELSNYTKDDKVTGVKTEKTYCSQPDQASASYCKNPYNYTYEFSEKFYVRASKPKEGYLLDVNGQPSGDSSISFPKLEYGKVYEAGAGGRMIAYWSGPFVNENVATETNKIKGARIVDSNGVLDFMGATIKADLVAPNKDMKAKFEKIAKGGEILSYYNIELSKSEYNATTQEEELIPVTTLGGNIFMSFTFDKNVLSKKGGEYFVIREHDGEFEVLETVADADASELGFFTDRFSTYAIAWREGNTKDEGIEPADTLDNIMNYVILGGASLIIMATAAIYGVKLRKTQK